MVYDCNYYCCKLVDGEIGMAIDFNGIVYLVLNGLTVHVFGRMEFTTLFLMIWLVVFLLLIRIPVPVALAIPIPFMIVLTAWGFLSIVAGGILIGIFFITAVGTLLVGLNID